MNSVSIKTYRMSDVKRIYRVLHRHLLANTDLIDSEILEDLQAYLQSCARLAGVDISDHEAWDRWLREEPVEAPVRPHPPQLRLIKS